MQQLFAGADLLVEGELRRGTLVVAGGFVESIVLGDGPSFATDDVVDATGLVISPGFIDLQCNGAVGVDITTDPSGIATVAQALPRFGVTSFLPTVVTSPPANRRAAIEAVRTLRERGAGSSDAEAGADAIGLHFEGPMISPRHLGAHPAHHVTAVDHDELDQWVASEVVTLVTLAPEVPGVLAAIERLVAGGVIVSGGHTAMSPSEFTAARASGMSYATHLFNAMAPFSHRAPGPVGAVLADDDIVTGVICDGIHVDPVAIRMAWRALGPARMSLVSDAVAALGMPYRRLDLAGFEIVHDQTGVRTSDGVLAGSALALDQAVRNLLTFTGCPLQDALATVTSTPADLLGLSDRGRLQAGTRADLTILDHDANLVATVIGGHVVHDARQGV